MRLAISAVGLAAMLGAFIQWPFNTINDWASTAMMVSAGLGLIVVASIVGIWWRNRQRRRESSMRDSALW